jgi:RHS repeat-associated protein
LADGNLYRFSSKEYHPNSGLVCYLYRFYDPNLQRWPNRDPLADNGFFELLSHSAVSLNTPVKQALLNLFMMVYNSPIDKRDPLGTKCWETPEDNLCGGISNSIARACCKALIKGIMSNQSARNAKCQFQKESCDLCCEDKWGENHSNPGWVLCNNECIVGVAKCIVGH